MQIQEQFNGDDKTVHEEGLTPERERDCDGHQHSAETTAEEAKDDCTEETVSDGHRHNQRLTYEIPAMRIMLESDIGTLDKLFVRMPFAETFEKRVEMMDMCRTGESTKRGYLYKKYLFEVLFGGDSRDG